MFAEGYNTSTWRKAARGVAVTASLTGVLALGASDRPVDDAGVNPKPTPSPAVDVGKLYWELPQGPCKQIAAMLSTPRREKVAATKCLTAQRHGKIALVTFSASRPETEGIATAMKEDLTDASEGLLTPTTTVFVASEKAQTTFAQTTAKTEGCVESNDVTNFASFAAARTMPEINGYDFVVGVTDKKACDSKEAGVADQDGGRYTDINDTSTSGLTSMQERKVLGKVGAHEVDHLYQLGHAGLLMGADRGYIILFKNEGLIDLGKYLPGCSYQEYGSQGNLMGTTAIDKKPTLNAIQLDDLRKPEVTLTDKSKAGAKDITGQRKILLVNNDYGVMNIPPLTFSDTESAKLTGNKAGVENIFDKLAFVPFANDDTIPGTSSVELFLIDSRNRHAASFGKVELNQVYSNQTFTVGSKKVVLSFDGTRTAVQTVG
jgi:hypothetical protein